MIVTRPMVAAELPFVLKGFLSSYRSSHFAGLIQDADWWAVMAPQVEKIIARPGWRCIVACDSEAELGVADLLGFAFGADDVLGYVYVKHHYRRMGVGRLLVRALGIDTARQFAYVAKTPVTSKLLHLAPGARFDPQVAKG